MRYTVIGIYGDNQQPWMTFVEEASSPKDAARKGIHNVHGEGVENVPLSEILVVEVFEGYIPGVLGNDSILSLEELKGD